MTETSLENLAYTDLDSIDDDFLFSEDCSQYIKLDWKVFSA